MISEDARLISQAIDRLTAAIGALPAGFAAVFADGEATAPTSPELERLFRAVLAGEDDTEAELPPEEAAAPKPANPEVGWNKVRPERCASCGLAECQCLETKLRKSIAANATRAFHSHLDGCYQCRNNPFSLCAAGASLLRTAGLAVEKTP